ncbi:MAG TPA: AarF/UbiB family protein [Acidimicrobiales bacterium]|nr:AarF/UbiB family protein [Acidimicrobiales bacterium]
MTSIEATDLEVGGFSESPPWTIDPEDLPWREGIEAIRRRTRDEVPLLLAPRKVPPARRMGRVARELGAALGAWYALDRRKGKAESRASVSRRLRLAFQHLGPTYIKLGQILSSGEGIFPEELVSQFKMLRDKVPAESFDVVRRTVEADLARPLEAVFSSFERTPIAAASIAQVHAARLRTGEDVVVKVQRPRVAELVRLDLAVMSWLAPHLTGRIPIAALANPPALIELFAQTIVEELDFRLEADNMLAVAAVLAETDQRAIVIPRPHPRLVTRRVLVMERLDGFSWDDVDGMKAAGIDTEAVLRAGTVSFLEGAMLFGVFHGDLHGGNLFVQDGGRVALLDFGITGRLDESQRLSFLRLLIGGTSNDVRGQVEALRDLGALPADCVVDDVIRDLGLNKPAQDIVMLSAEELTAEIRELTKGLLAYGARLPKELMLFVKNMLFLDGAVATLAPEVDLLGEIASIAMYFASRHGDRITRDIGIDPRETKVDLDGVRASMGLPTDVRSINYREIQNRREQLRQKFDKPR